MFSPDPQRSGGGSLLKSGFLENSGESDSRFRRCCSSTDFVIE